MKKLILIIGVFWCGLSFGQKDPIPPMPNPPKLVNDFADKLIPEQEEFLERKLRAYDDSTSNQIAIVIVQSIEGMDPSQYAT